MLQPFARSRLPGIKNDLSNVQLTEDNFCPVPSMTGFGDFCNHSVPGLVFVRVEVSGITVFFDLLKDMQHHMTLRLEYATASFKEYDAPSVMRKCILLHILRSGGRQKVEVLSRSCLTSCHEIPKTRVEESQIE